MFNYIEVLLWSEDHNEACLIRKYTENIKELLDDISAVQNLNSDIYNFFEISIKETALILVDKFGCTSNLVNLINTIEINKNIRFDKHGNIPIDNLDLITDLKIKNINSFSINAFNLWENYSIRRYHECAFKKYIEDEELCQRMKTFIYYGMEEFISNNGLNPDLHLDILMQDIEI